MFTKDFWLKPRLKWIDTYCSNDYTSYTWYGRNHTVQFSIMLHGIVFLFALDVNNMRGINFDFLCFSLYVQRG